MVKIVLINNSSRFWQNSRNTKIGETPLIEDEKDILDPLFQIVSLLSVKLKTIK